MPTRAPLSPRRSKPGSALRLRSRDSWAQRTGRERKPHLRGNCGGGEGREPEPPGGGRGARAHGSAQQQGGRKAEGEGVTLGAGLPAAPASIAELGGAEQQEEEEAVAAGV